MSPKEKTKLAGIVELIRDGRGEKGGVKALGVNGFAKVSGISPALVSRYMNDKVGEPTTATLQKLADYFGVSVAELRGENASAYSIDKEGFIDLLQKMHGGKEAQGVTDINKLIELLVDETLFMADVMLKLSKIEAFRNDKDERDGYLLQLEKTVQRINMFITLVDDTNLREKLEVQLKAVSSVADFLKGIDFDKNSSARFDKNPASSD